MTLEEIAAAGIDPAKVTALPDGGWTYQSGPLSVTWGPDGPGRGWDYETTLATPDGPDGTRQDTVTGWTGTDADVLRMIASASLYHETARRIEAGEFRTTTEGEHDDGS